MNVILKFFLLITSILLGLLAIAVIRALILPKEHLPVSCISNDDDYISDERGLSRRFSQAIKFNTISYEFHTYNEEAILKFTEFIKDKFPLIHSSPLITREVVNNFSLLYYIKGSDSSLKPFLLAGHLDVVPVEESYWDVPPFSGQIKDGYIWGRGTIDCKHVVMGSLEALEFLLSKGYKPKRSFYLAYGHDEEVSGLDGAQQINMLLESRNVTLEYILDEGAIILDNLVPFTKFPLALIGISEKGSLNVEVSVQVSPGHSSIPSRETAIVILAKALSKLEGNLFPSMFGRGPEKQMMEELAYCSPFPVKVVFGNIWLFKPFFPLFLRTPLMNAIHRTTTAVTVVSGGYKINVLPSTATAKINFRIHPAQTIPEVLEYLKNVINDERIQIKVLSETPPHPISPIDTFGYLTIKKSIKQIFNDSCVVPTTLIASTDTRWYLNLTKSIYRFSLVRMLPKDTNRFHGHNERISVTNYIQLVNFFLHLMKNSDSQSVEAPHIHEDL